MFESILTLSDDSTYSGYSPDWQKGKQFSGEVVFTTGMTGYVETLTDPSFAGQIVVFTYPLLGNYGVPEKKFWESKQIYAKGVVVDTAIDQWSHYSGTQSFVDWLQEQNVPLITGIDTRALTKQIREHGVMLGGLHEPTQTPLPFYDPNQENLVAQVSCTEKETFGTGTKKIIAIDCGMKENIFRSLLHLNCTIEKVPYNYDFTNEPYDAVFISNGPGNPEMAAETIDILKKAMQIGKPMFGICLGSQLMGIAAGASTYKLPYGHRGQNQPCKEQTTKSCLITSQNHGYALDENTIPEDWIITYKNLNDGSIEGIAHKTKPFFSVQFHPEASPGPTDAAFLFQSFADLL